MTEFIFAVMWVSRLRGHSCPVQRVRHSWTRSPRNIANQTDIQRLAAGALRPRRAGAAGRRRARRLPGRRLPGAARSRHRAGLGLGRLDRRHQFGDHRRQPAASSGCAQLRTFWERITERKIWHYTPDGDVFRKARNAASCWLTMHAGPARLLRAAHRQPVVEPARRHDARPATTTARRCARRCSSWSISR